MGWTISIQLVRDRALDRDEVLRLRQHVQSSGLARQGYAFEVAPPGTSGVIAKAGGKLLSSPDPETDTHAAKLFTALTELRGLFADARLEIADDMSLVGWDGTAVTLVEDPDQELTAAPGDGTGWVGVPARRSPPAPRPPPRTVLALPRALEEALNAVLAGGEPGDLSALGRDDASAVLRAIAKVTKSKNPDFTVRKALGTVAAQLPARAIVDAALAEIRLLETWARDEVAEAMARLPDRATVREAVLATWRQPLPAKYEAAFQRSDGITFALLMPLAEDPWVIAQLGDEQDAAQLEARNWVRRDYNRHGVLARSPEGVRRLIRRRRRDRDERRQPLSSILHSISEARFELAVPTLLIDLAVSRDRDYITLALARYGEPRLIPILQRMLTTDQYTRAVALALYHFDSEEATTMLHGLLDHEDPLVRIRAARGLVIRRGVEAMPQLIDAVRSARAMGIWRHEYAPSSWCSEQLALPADALAHPPGYRDAWPEAGEIDFGSEPPTTELPAAAIDRMLSPNPDIRRDAIELAHKAAIIARDGRMALTLARAERLHTALCHAVELPMATADGICSRVDISGFWSDPMWRKVAKIPFNPGDKYDWVTWDWLEAHVREHVAQDIAPQLADVCDAPSAAARAATYTLHPLRFTRAEWDAWNAEEASIVAAVAATPGGATYEGQ